MLHIEVWEKRVVGSDVCLGRLQLPKLALPPGTSKIEGCWSQYVTIPLCAPRDRKNKGEPVRCGSVPMGASPPNGSASMSSIPSLSPPSMLGSMVYGNIPSEGSLTPPMLSPTSSGGGSPPYLSRDGTTYQHAATTTELLLESSSEASHSTTNAPRGTLTFRVNYETRHQEWRALAPLRGKFFFWGAVRSQLTCELVLIPELAQNVDELLGSRSVRSLSMSSSGFVALCEDASTVHFGMSYERIMDGESACSVVPRLRHIMPNGQKIMAVAHGTAHFLTLMDDGHLYSAGLNSRGELGQGTASDEPDFTLKRVVGLNSEFIVGMCGGQRCSLAWSKEGKLFSWGDATLVRMWTPETDWIDGPFDHLAHTDEDEASRDNRDLAPVPKRVQGLEGVKIVRAWTNLFISAALSDTGDLYTWGDHHCAGYDTKNLNVQYPQKIELLAGRVAEAAVGASFVIARDLDGQLWSWGCAFQKNDNPIVSYPLGRGGDRSFHPVKIPNLPKITSVMCLGNTSFAIDFEGQLWCWGESRYGECFKPHATFGRPLRCEYFQDLKVELLARGFGTSMCVKTSSS